MLKNCKKIWELLNIKQKFMLILLLIMTILGTGLELLAVSSINPFVELISNPQVLKDGDSLVRTIYLFLDSPN